MRVLLLADIHGNIDALDAVLSDVERRSWRPDQILVMGDLVDYGPAPESVVKWAQRYADAIVCGNHDYAAGTGNDCRSAPLFHELAVETRNEFRRRTEPATLLWLAGLPLHLTRSVATDRWQLVHATPRSPLFEYISAVASDDAWREALGDRDPRATVVLLGHSHEPFIRAVDDDTLVNPGSVGLPKDDDPRASYATWEHGRFELHRVAYDTEHAVLRYATLDITAGAKRQLAAVLRTGSLVSLTTARRSAS